MLSTELPLPSSVGNVGAVAWPSGDWLTLQTGGGRRQPGPGLSSPLSSASMGCSGEPGPAADGRWLSS